MNIIKRKLLKLVLRGKNVTCPICRGEFITFLPFGLTLRPNAHCPKCGSLERHRLMWEFLKRETDFFQKKLRVLHVAPERMFMVKFKKLKNLDYVAGDKFDGGFDHSYSKDVVFLDITDIKFENHSFDVIICSHVLEHVPDDIKAMKEMHRVLKKGGWAILQVPIDRNLSVTYEDANIIDPTEREKAFGQFDHVRLYGLDYKNRLEEAGFEVDVIDYFSSFSANEQFRLGLLNDAIYLCKKS